MPERLAATGAANSRKVADLSEKIMRPNEYLELKLRFSLNGFRSGARCFIESQPEWVRCPRPAGACEGSAFVEQGEAQTSRTTPRPLVADDQLGRAFLRAVRRRVRRFMRWLPPPVCGPAFGSCSGGASGGDAWASASDTVNTSAEGTAMVNPASPSRESALRREITSDVLISNLPDFEVDEKADNQAYRGRVADQGPRSGPLLPGLIEPPTHALSNRRAAAATDLALSGSRSYWCGAYGSRRHPRA
jgi:hypothetical protein